MAEIILEIPGIIGECTTESFKEMIVCKDLSVSFTQEIERSTNARRTVHTVNIEDITINREFDKSSTLLLDHVVTGKVSATATIHVLKAVDAGDGTSQVEFLKYILTNCVVASHALNAGESDLAETIVLNFTKIAIEYSPTDENNKVTGKLTTNYNVLLGKKE